MLTRRFILSAPAGLAVAAALPATDVEAAVAAEPNVSTGWGWFASSDWENYTIGPCATREECIEEAKANELGLNYARMEEPYSFSILEGRQDPIDLSRHVDPDLMIERMIESVEEQHGNEDGDLATGITQVQFIDLEDMIKATVRAWQEKHNIVVKPWSFTDIRNSADIVVEPTPV
jgi:hypothetical protein